MFSLIWFRFNDNNWTLSDWRGVRQMQHRIIELGKNKIDFLDTFLVILLVIWSCPGAFFRPKLMKLCITDTISAGEIGLWETGTGEDKNEWITIDQHVWLYNNIITLVYPCIFKFSFFYTIIIITQFHSVTPTTVVKWTYDVGHIIIIVMQRDYSVNAGASLRASDPLRSV